MEGNSNNTVSKRALEIRELWTQTNTGKRQQWETQEQQSYEYYMNEQLSQQEKDELESSGMPTFIINRITPVIEIMKYFITANNPRWKAVGAQGADSAIAQIHTDLIDYCWYISGGKGMFSDVINNVLIKSKGYVLVTVDPDDDRGLGEVKIVSVDPFTVYTSTMSSDPYERDAAYQIIKQDIARRDLVNLLPDYKSKVMKATGFQDAIGTTSRDQDSSAAIFPGDVETPMDPETNELDDILPYYELYTPLTLKYWHLVVQIPPPDSELAEARDAIDNALIDYSNQLKVQVLETEVELRKELEAGNIIKQRYDLELERANNMALESLENKRAELLARVREEATKTQDKVVSDKEYEILMQTESDSIVSANSFYKTKYKLECVVGDQFLYEEIINSSSCPLVAIPYMHTGTPYPMSAVTPLVGKQQEINKAHQIMIHNANLSSNLRWTYVEGEIDEDLWEKYAASPGALLPRRPGFSPNGPTPILPQNINNAFFTIQQTGENDLEYMSGVHPPSMGIPGGQDDTYRGLLAKDEFATRRIRSWISNVLEPALEHIGKILLEMSQAHYDIHKVFRIVQPNPAGSFDERQVEINVPIYNDVGEEIGRFNDYSTTRYDIRIVPGSTLPLNRWAMLEEYKQWYELGIIDDIAFVQLTDIPDKEALMKRKSMLSQLKQQVGQMEEALKERDGTIETLSRQLVQAGIKDQVRDANVEIDRNKTQTKSAHILSQERMKDALNSMRSELKTESQALKSKKTEKKSK